MPQGATRGWATRTSTLTTLTMTLTLTPTPALAPALAPALVPALAPALVLILTLTPTLTRCKEGWHGRPGRRLSPLSPREGCRRLPPQRPTARRKPPGRSRLWSCLRARRLCRGPRRCGSRGRPRGHCRGCRHRSSGRRASRRHRSRSAPTQRGQHRWSCLEGRRQGCLGGRLQSRGRRRRRRGRHRNCRVAAAWRTQAGWLTR